FLCAMVAKLVGASFRYWLLFSIYGGTGDAVEYQRVGVQVAQVWRELSVPAIDTVPITGSFGTKLVAWLTGLLYVPFEQSILGGFWLFSLLAFNGQVFLYLAFRNAAAPPPWRGYAVVVFFLPASLLWTSCV